jgi:polyisoprenoid-binding protein YceI
MKCLWFVLVALSVGWFRSQAQETYRLDPKKSVIQIQVDTSGALGFMGHQHLIQAPIEHGNFVYYPGDLGKSFVEILVDAGALAVIDPKVSAKDRMEILATMRSDRVLGVQQYPKIIFKSVKIQPLDGNRLQLSGDLTIRSQTNLVTVEAILEQAGPVLKVAGKSRFKQTAFGIKPVSAGLGAVRVKDQLNISFQVFGQPKADHGP